MKLNKGNSEFRKLETKAIVRTKNTFVILIGTFRSAELVVTNKSYLPLTVQSLLYNRATDAPQTNKFLIEHALIVCRKHVFEAGLIESAIHKQKL